MLVEMAGVIWTITLAVFVIAMFWMEFHKGS